MPKKKRSEKQPAASKAKKKEPREDAPLRPLTQAERDTFEEFIRERGFKNPGQLGKHLNEKYHIGETTIFDPISTRRNRYIPKLITVSALKDALNCETEIIAKMLVFDLAGMEKDQTDAAGSFDKTAEELPDKSLIEALTKVVKTSIRADASKSIYDWNFTDGQKWRTTSNGLQYKIYKMLHRELDRFDRGKCYSFDHFSSEEQHNLKDKLKRHPEICKRVGKHPNFPVNRTAFWETENKWWVIDEWIEGQTLAEHLKTGPFQQEKLPLVMCGIAEGLKKLHELKIIRRELTPEFIILQEPDRTPILTDFEMAKLLGTDPTVRPNERWPENPYRAPEVEGASDSGITIQADFFSWAAIFVHAATGKPAKEPTDWKSYICKADLPGGVRKIVTDCLSLGHSSRPKKIDQLIKVVRRWK